VITTFLLIVVWTVIALAGAFVLGAVLADLAKRARGGAYLPAGVEPVKHPATEPPLDVPAWVNETYAAPKCPNYVPQEWVL
jgi:hypothetical protein